MELNFFIETLFDLINESDALETDLLDIRTEENTLIVTMKDGTQFELQAKKAQG